jgi:hypothetical protein
MTCRRCLDLAHDLREAAAGLEAASLRIGAAEDDLGRMLDDYADASRRYGQLSAEGVWERVRHRRDELSPPEPEELRWG